jgi:hypothetical protein
LKESLLLNIALPKVIYRFNAIAMKISMANTVLKNIFRKNNKVVGITLPDLKIYYKPIVIKTVCYWHMVNWSRTVSLEVNHVS